MSAATGSEGVLPTGKAAPFRCRAWIDFDTGFFFFRWWCILCDAAGIHVPTLQSGVTALHENRRAPLSISESKTFPSRSVCSRHGSCCRPLLHHIQAMQNFRKRDAGRPDHASAQFFPGHRQDFPGLFKAFTSIKARKWELNSSHKRDISFDAL